MPCFTSHPLSPSSRRPSGWGHYWSITPTGSDFTADVTLPHDVIPQANAKACRFVSGTTWDCQQDAVTADTVTYTGTTHFSDWAVGNLIGPTAVTLQALRARSAGGASALTGLALLAGLIAGLGVWRFTRRALPLR